jgi:putative restriction endonuclease
VCGEAVLEAAHIIPYRGPQTNHVANGLLLRADLHTLFDLGMITVDGATKKLLVSDELAETIYARFHGKPVRLPDQPANHPSPEALERHRIESGLEW